MNNQTIDAKLLFASNLIQNGQNVPTVNAALLPYGYDEATLFDK